MNEAIRDAVAKGVAFIEANLHSGIGVSDVADAAHYSQFYFSREFTRFAHISVYDYILRRKLSESYKELFQKQCKIVDLACRYGFQSHEVYTRAFRKMFGENPSEAAVYKPLALYEALDEPYLDFLSGLRVERINEAAEDCRFDVTGASSAFETGDDTDYLVLFSRENRFRRQCVFHGNLQQEKSGLLSFGLCRLRHELRLYCANPQSAFRHYTNHFYDGSAENANYVILQANQYYIDILRPCVQ